MIFDVLKLFGLDIPAKLEAMKANVEQQLEGATNHVKHVAQGAAIIAALCAFATILALLAVMVGLFALYWWVAETYGVFAGLGAVGALLAVATAVLLSIAVAKANSLGAQPGGSAHRSRKLANLEETDVTTRSAVASPAEPLRNSSSSRPQPLPALAAPAPTLSASELLEPLSYLLSGYLKFPTFESPVLNEAMGKIRDSAKDTAEEAMHRAAGLIRTGDRAQLVIVLSSATLVGWLLTRQARR